MRSIRVAMVVGLVAVTVSDSASGQEPSPVAPPQLQPNKRPTTSPYLNLLGTNPGSGAFAFQYFRRVRPEFEFRRANSQFQRSLRDLEHRLDQPEQQQAPQSGLGPTGHPAAFFNYRGYYGSRNAGGGASSGFGTRGSPLSSRRGR